MHPYLRYALEKKAESIDCIRRFVECETPSDSPADVNRFVDLLTESARDIATPKTFRSPTHGRHLRLDFKLPGRRKKGRILGIGHSDTVWPLGTLKIMPFRNHKGRLWGPGVFDLKAGIVFFLYAARCLRDLDVAPAKNVSLLVVSDEEIGSKTSRALTEAEAKQSDCVLVLEPGTGLDGKLKTSRKGVGGYIVSVEGKAAHAGVDFNQGASAIVELARQIDKIAGFTDLARGTTINPGIIAGGTRPNVIAAKAHVHVDVRVAHMKDAATLDKKFRTLRPFDKRCSLQVEGGLNRPPMERTKAIVGLFQKARQFANELGVHVEETSTGGGSDGNFTAALGVPTLDGLGAVGEGAHALHESILIDRIADRTALLAGLLAGL
ncbi:MAG: M20 family metallopeptidase [Acidobacteriaceae bacterium]|nr:M20 family metallopeptidase [Acidobacteriaceae bacterium]